MILAEILIFNLRLIYSFLKLLPVISIDLFLAIIIFIYTLLLLVPQFNYKLDFFRIKDFVAKHNERKRIIFGPFTLLIIKIVNIKMKLNIIEPILLIVLFFYLYIIIDTYKDFYQYIKNPVNFLLNKHKIITNKYKIKDFYKYDDPKEELFLFVLLKLENDSLNDVQYFYKRLAQAVSNNNSDETIDNLFFKYWYESFFCKIHSTDKKILFLSSYLNNLNYYISVPEIKQKYFKTLIKKMINKKNPKDTNITHYKILFSTFFKNKTQDFGYKTYFCGIYKENEFYNILIEQLKELTNKKQTLTQWCENNIGHIMSDLEFKKYLKNRERSENDE